MFLLLSALDALVSILETSGPRALLTDASSSKPASFLFDSLLSSVGEVPIPSGLLELVREVTKGLFSDINPIARASRAQGSEPTSVEPEFDSGSFEILTDETFNEFAWTSESSSVVAGPAERDRVYTGEGVRGKSSYKFTKKIKLNMNAKHTNKKLVVSSHFIVISGIT